MLGTGKPFQNMTLKVCYFFLAQVSSEAVMAAAYILPRMCARSTRLYPRMTLAKITDHSHMPQRVTVACVRCYSAEGRPRVYFDVTANDEKLGRIEFEVRTVEMTHSFWNDKMIL